MTNKELARIRENLGLTIEKLAELTQISAATIRKQEIGTWGIPTGMAQIYIATEEHVLGDRIRWFLCGKENISTEWYRGPWNVYASKEDAEAAYAIYKEFGGSEEREAVEVYVRGDVGEAGSGREEWLDLKLVCKKPEPVKEG